MNKPEKYYQIMIIEENGTLAPLDTSKYGDPDRYFKFQYDANEFIKNNFTDAQDGVNPIHIDLMLTILPIWLVKHKI